MFLLMTLALALGSHAQPTLAQTATIEGDDCDIFDLVFEQIRLRAGGQTLRVGRKESDPIAVLDHARPLCRQKVDPYEMSWPLFSAPIVRASHSYQVGFVQRRLTRLAEAN